MGQSDQLSASLNGKSMNLADDQAIFAEQIEYYRARAAEYEEWYRRRGRYDHGPQWNRIFAGELEEVEREVRGFKPAGRVLELASGTGWWTEILAQYADSITAVDSSAETLELNRGKNGAARIEYIQAELFSWRPQRQYDAVFFGFWLSHVPPGRFAEFWDIVGAALHPGGRVFFVDSLRRDLQTLAAKDHHRSDPEEDITTRYLNDGSAYRIIKVFYEPAELEERLRELGWEFSVKATEHYFLSGQGRRAGHG